MKIAIISDVHDNLINLERALRWMREYNVETILCAGDLTNFDTLNYLANSFAGKIYIVQGNGCNYNTSDIKKFPNIHNLGRNGAVIELAGKKIGLCHEPRLAQKLFADNPEIIFYGHTHKPWDQYEEGIRLVNPGNISNTRFPPTFAYWDTERGLQLILVDELK